jgi:IS4 transposase
LSAALVSQLYRQRWKIELFFRWVKCILGCGHWLAESERGVTIQI